MKIPTVALIGKPNVGKSTLFNRIAGKRISIIEDTPGVTRDRIYSLCTYKDYKFHLIDTGGISLENETFSKEIRMQAELAIEEADVIVFVVDGKEGITADDRLINEMLRKSSKKIIIAINKTDNKIAKENVYDFYEFGYDDYISISAEHGNGTYDLLDTITSNFKDVKDIEYDSNVIKFCVIGRPNVGKSSLVNTILNEERSIVSDISGTTRDSIDTPFTYEKQDFVVIDTAGIRKQGKIYENIERYSVLRALKAIDRSDVCLIVLNAEEGIIEYDKHIAGYALESGKAVVLVVNKWDKTDESIDEFKKKIRNQFVFMPYAPIVFLSALTKKRIHTLMPEVLKVYDNWHKEVKTSLLNDVINDAVTLNSPPSYKGKRLKIYFVSQIDKTPPKFLFQVNDKTLIHFSYERYLENKIRESFDFEGTPIVLSFKNRGE
jgi:GTP-binding protein